jgi:hypothetical protein
VTAAPPTSGTRLIAVERTELSKVSDTKYPKKSLV